MFRFIIPKFVLSLKLKILYLFMLENEKKSGKRVYFDSFKEPHI